MKPKKTHMAVLIAILLPLSCNQPTPATRAASSTNTMPIDSTPILQVIDTVANNITTQTDTTTNVKKTPQKPSKQERRKAPPNTHKNKPDPKTPTFPQRYSSDLAKENKPQKIIGNEYFEVVEGCYCNDNWGSNPYHVGCKNCRFCREIMVSVISEDTVYFKQMWAGGYVKNITAHTKKGGRGGLGGCIGFGPEYHKYPPPIPYQGQALISYAVGDPNAEIRYFDVTNLLKWCGKFHAFRKPTPKNMGPFK